MPTVKRGNTKGWTTTATRSNRKFLWSVKFDQLGANGYSFTLTVRNCPDTAADWTRLRRALVKRLMRVGAVRLHWLTEWQARGVPHLHGCVWFPDDSTEDGTTVLYHWLQLTRSQYGSTPRGQNAKPITSALGWLKYLAKHADRGVYNYQRASASVPAGWKASTGRMWGHVGEWPLTEPQRLVVDDAGAYALRRIAQRWRLAQARSEADQTKRVGRIKSARRMLQAPNRARSSVRGVSEWMPRDVARRALMHLAAAGYEFTWSPDVQEADTQTLPGFELDLTLPQQ